MLNVMKQKVKVGHRLGGLQPPDIADRHYPLQHLNMISRPDKILPQMDVMMSLQDPRNEHKHRKG